MYFDDVELFDYENSIDNRDKLYAHKFNDNIELLEEHMDLCMHYLNKIIHEKKLDKIFFNIENSIFKDSNVYAVKLYKEMLCNAVYCHDLGKSNPDFQVIRLLNMNFKESKKRNPKHSLTSSVIYFNYYLNKLYVLNKDEEFSLLLLILIINSYTISKHHGYLDELIRYLEDLRNLLNYDDKPEYINCLDNKFELLKDLIKKISFSKTAKYIEKKEKWIFVDLYIYSRLVFSMIVTCDFYATSHFQNNKEISDYGLIDDIDEYIKIFEETEVSKKITEARLNGINQVYMNNDINKLRTEIFLQSDKNLIRNIDNDIFFLEAPTGSGKTNMAINLSLKLIKQNKDLNRIFYIFPFNTLVEQTKKSLYDVFGGSEEIKSKIAVINSITSIKTYEDDSTGIPVGYGEEKIDYDKSLLARQFIHYPVIITTHVKLFNILFGTDRDSVFPLLHVANSVLVLDEIQSYKNNIWKEFIILLKMYSKLLNIKIIIMSATLPDLSILSYDKDKFCKLIDDSKKFYYNPLFKNRVELDYSLLSVEKEELEYRLIQKIFEEYNAVKNKKTLENKIIVEFIRKKSAVNFYETIKRLSYENNIDAEILLMTGYDSRHERGKIVNKVRTGNNIILIATQVVEAGVDIDMDIGFKNISILDSEEQFLGRINRSCRKEGCKAFFFNMDDSAKIYRDDIRNTKEFTLIMDNMKDILKNKDFDIYYNMIIEQIDKSKNKENEKNIEKFRTELLGLFKYDKVEELMKLIDQKNKFTLFLNSEIEDEEGNILIGKDIWKEYCDTLSDRVLSYAEKRVKLSKTMEKMDYFTYEVDEITFSYNDRIGDFIYIEDGEKFLENGKININLIKQSDKFEMI